MGTLESKRNAIKVVADAAQIHSDYLKGTLTTDRHQSRSFNSARAGYVDKVNAAISEVLRIKFDESAKISERVSDLNLEDSVDLLHAVEDHIRSLRRTARSNFS